MMDNQTTGGNPMGEGRDWTAQTLAAAAGVTDAYVRHLCILGAIKGEKFGYQWRIPYAVGQRFIEERQGGGQQ